MEVRLSKNERQLLLLQAQRACWEKAGYVPVTVLLMLDQGEGGLPSRRTWTWTRRWSTATPRPIGRKA